MASWAWIIVVILIAIGFLYFYKPDIFTGFIARFKTSNISLPILSCKPNWLYNGIWLGADSCKTACYAGAKVTSFKEDKTNLVLNNYTSQPFDACFCDINNCNPQ